MRSARIFLFLLVAAAIWLPGLHLFYGVSAPERGRLVRAMAEHTSATSTRTAPMRAVNPEWDFMQRTYSVLGLANLARRPGVTEPFGWAREWPRGAPMDPDVDSGPIVPLLDASAGSSGLAILGASAFHDEPWRDALLASLELGGVPDREHATWRASNAVGDAVVFYSRSMTP